MDSIEKIKQVTQNIDLDATARRIFEECLVMCKDSAKDILEAIEISKNNSCTEINPSDVVYMIFGRKRLKGNLQHVHHEFNKTKKGAVFEEIYEDMMMQTIVMNRINFDNPNNFVKQIINLTYAFGGSIVPYSAKINSKIHCSLKLKNGERYCFKPNELDEYGDLGCVLHNYYSYCLLVYNEKLKCKDKKNAIKRLIKKTSLGELLHEKLKDFFDNEDFIYAIMRYLKTDWHRERLLLMVEKNESMCVYSKMNNIRRYVSDAAYLSTLSKNSNITFIRERFKTETGKKLFDLLKSIKDEEQWVIGILYAIRSDADRQKVIDFIESGNTENKAILSFVSKIEIQNVKNKIEEYLNNKINLSELNKYFRENVPFSENSTIEKIRLDADMTIEEELTQNDIDEELINEPILKEKLRKYLKKL